MLHKYQNELMIGVMALVLLGAIMFKTSQHTELQDRSVSTQKLASRIEDIAIMNKLWKKDRSISRKLKMIKQTLSTNKVKKFKIDKKKADIVLENLNASELNNITGKSIASLSVQIIELSIQRNDKSYRLELRCKW